MINPMLIKYKQRRNHKRPRRLPNLVEERRNQIREQHQRHFRHQYVPTLTHSITILTRSDNEYHEMDQELVLNLNQAAIDGIRAAGATSQYIFVEGNSWSGAWTWVDVNDNLKALTDPEDKIVYEMHQYLDSDGSGTSETCVSATIGTERVADATQWLKDNKKIGIIGEFAGGNNDLCRTAIEGLLDSLQADSDVWLGALWWAAGPWWADYINSIEPPSGIAYEGMLDTLKPYLG